MKARTVFIIATILFVSLVPGCGGGGGGGEVGTGGNPVGPADSGLATLRGTVTLDSLPIANAGVFLVKPSRAFQAGLVNLSGAMRSAMGSAEQANSSVAVQAWDHRTTTDPAGMFTFSEIPIGEYTLMAMRDQAHQVVRTNVVVGAVSQVDVQLTPTGSITGTVAISGETFLGSIIVYLEGTSYVAVTDSTGHFTISNVPAGTFRIQAQKGGMISAFQTVTVQPGTVNALPGIVLDPINLPNTAKLSGTIRKSLLKYGDKDHSGIFVALNGTTYISFTNAEGQFRFTNVAPGQYQVTIAVSDYVPVDGTPDPLAVDLAANGDVTLPTILIRPKVLTGRLSGRVILPPGASADSMRFISARLATTTFQDVTTTVEGDLSFAFKDVPYGSYNLDFPGGRFLPASPTPLVITVDSPERQIGGFGLVPAPSSAVQVVGSLTSPLPTELLTAVLKPESASARVHETPVGSEFRFPDVGPGSYSLVLKAGSGYQIRPAARTSFSLDGRTDPVKLCSVLGFPQGIPFYRPSIATATYLEGWVDITGADLASEGAVFLLDGVIYPMSQVVGGSRLSTFVGPLTSGKHAIQVKNPDGAFTDPAAALAVPEIPKGKVTGRVEAIYPSGEVELGAVTVRLVSPSLPSQFSSVTTGGEFWFPQVIFGSYTLEILANGWNPASATPIRISVATSSVNLGLFRLLPAPGGLIDVIGSMSTPLPGVQFEITMTETGGRRGVYTSFVALNGEFRLTDLPPGSFSIGLRSNQGGYQLRPTEIVSLFPDEAFVQANQRLGQSGGLQWYRPAIASAGFENGSIWVQGSDLQGSSTILMANSVPYRAHADSTATSAVFDVGSLPAGRIQVQAKNPDGAFSDPDFFIEIPEQQKGMLFGNVVRMPVSGKPLTGNISVRLSSPTQAGLLTVADSNGNFSFTQAPLGNYTLDFYSQGYAAASAAPILVQFRNPSQNAGDFQMVPIPTGLVEVIGSLSSPLSDRNLEILLKQEGGAGKLFSSWSNLSGEFRFSDVPPGSYSLRIKAGEGFQFRPEARAIFSVGTDEIVVLLTDRLGIPEGLPFYRPEITYKLIGWDDSLYLNGSDFTPPDCRVRVAGVDYSPLPQGAGPDFLQVQLPKLGRGRYSLQVFNGDGSFTDPENNFIEKEGRDVKGYLGLPLDNSIKKVALQEVGWWPSQVTDVASNGMFLFTDVPVGTYQMTLLEETGFQFRSQARQVFSVTASDTEINLNASFSLVSGLPVYQPRIYAATYTGGVCEIQGTDFGGSQSIVIFEGDGGDYHFIPRDDSDDAILFVEIQRFFPGIYRMKIRNPDEACSPVYPFEIPLPAPVVKSIRSTENSVTVSWEPVPSATFYRIVAPPLAWVSDITDTEFTFVGLSPNSSYTATIMGLNRDQLSNEILSLTLTTRNRPFSEPKIATTSVALPTDPATRIEGRTNGGDLFVRTTVEASPFPTVISSFDLVDDSQAISFATDSRLVTSITQVESSFFLATIDGWGTGTIQAFPRAGPSVDFLNPVESYVFPNPLDQLHFEAEDWGDGANQLFAFSRNSGTPASTTLANFSQDLAPGNATDTTSRVNSGDRLLAPTIVDEFVVEGSSLHVIPFWGSLDTTISFGSEIMDLDVSEYAQWTTEDLFVLTADGMLRRRLYSTRFETGYAVFASNSVAIQVDDQGRPWVFQFDPVSGSACLQRYSGFLTLERTLELPVGKFQLPVPNLGKRDRIMLFDHTFKQIILLLKEKATGNLAIIKVDPGP